MFKYTRVLLASFVVGVFSLNANAGWLSSASQPVSDTATLTGEALYTPAVKKAWQDDVTSPLKSTITATTSLVKAPFMLLQGKRCNWK